MKHADVPRRFALAGALLLAVTTAACSSTAVAPEPSKVTPSVNSEPVTIRVDDVALEGRLFGADNDVAVILSHMRRGDQTAWFDFAMELAEAGYAALTFNFRGYGESDGDQDYDFLDEDLLAAVAFARDRGSSQIFLVGASMGGTATLVVAELADIDGAIAVSAPSRFAEQDALAAVAAIAEPKLLIASEDVTGDMVSLEELLEAARGPKERATFSGTAHGTDLFDPELSEHHTTVRERVLRFLEEHRNP